jgi:hypothetical protein
VPVDFAEAKRSPVIASHEAPHAQGSVQGIAQFPKGVGPGNWRQPAAPVAPPAEKAGV